MDEATVKLIYQKGRFFASAKSETEHLVSICGVLGRNKKVPIRHTDQCQRRLGTKHSLDTTSCNACFRIAYEMEG